MIRVLVAVHYFPYYRLPILRELSLDESIDYTFLFGLTAETEIKIINPVEYGLNCKIIKNVWLFNRKILWQIGLLRECVFGNYHSIILMGYPFAISTWLAIVLSRLSGKRVFLWAHATIRTKIRDKLKVIFFKLAHVLLLYGNWAKQNLIRYGFKEENMFVVYNSLDYANQMRLRTQLRPDALALKRKDYFSHPDYPVLLFVGRLTPAKKLEQLIIAGKALHNKGVPVNILFVGSGQEQEKLSNLCNQENLQSYIAFYGECYDEQELSVLIALADVCVSPGNVGLTAIHALTYGTPVITHDNPLEQGPEFEAIRPGETGTFFKQGSTVSLTEAILEWLQSHQTNREQLRAKCYEIIDKFYNPASQARIIRSAILKQ